jgi:hypothetical protein
MVLNFLDRCLSAAREQRKAPSFLHDWASVFTTEQNIEPKISDPGVCYISGPMGGFHDEPHLRGHPAANTPQARFRDQILSLPYDADFNEKNPDIKAESEETEPQLTLPLHSPSGNVRTWLKEQSPPMQKHSEQGTKPLSPTAPATAAPSVSLATPLTATTNIYRSATSYAWVNPSAQTQNQPSHSLHNSKGGRATQRPSTRSSWDREQTHDQVTRSSSAGGSESPRITAPSHSLPPPPTSSQSPAPAATATASATSPNRPTQRDSLQRVTRTDASPTQYSDRMIPRPTSDTPSDKTKMQQSSSAVPKQAGASNSYVVRAAQQVSAECQKRGYNPKFHITAHPEQGFRCDVWIQDRFIPGDKAWPSDSQAKDAVARKALALMGTWPARRDAYGGGAGASGGVTGGSGRVTRPNMTVADQRRIEDQKRVDAARAQAAARATQAIHSWYRSPRVLSDIQHHSSRPRVGREPSGGAYDEPPSGGIMIPGRYALDPLASRAFLEGYQIGCGGSGGGSSSSHAGSKERHAGRSRSRSPRVTSGAAVRARSPLREPSRATLEAPARGETAMPHRSGIPLTYPLIAAGDYYPPQAVDRAYAEGAYDLVDSRGMEVEQYYPASGSILSVWQ